jgi:hypothetical protein
MISTPRATPRDSIMPVQYVCQRRNRRISWIVPRHLCVFVAQHPQAAGKLTALPEAQVAADARAALEGVRKRANWR